MTAPPAAPRRAPRLLLLAAGSSGLAIGALVLLRAAAGADAQLAFEGHLLYWWMPVLLVAVAAAAGWRIRAAALRPGAWLRSQAPVLVTALALTLVVVAAVPPAMRVQWDETNLLATSKGMHELRGAFVATEAIVQDGAVVELDYMVDKRPPLFPFAVSLLHDVRGFSQDNPFLLNAAALFLLLATVGGAVRARCGVLAGILAAVLLLDPPIVITGARSAGFELFAALLLAAAIVAARRYLRAPDLPALAWLLASGALFAYARYESVAVFATLVAPTLWCTRRHWARDQRALALLVVWPALLTPLAFQFIHAGDRDFYSESDGGALVSLGHAIEHVPGWLRANFALSFDAPFAGIWSWLAVIGLLARLILGRLDAATLVTVLPVLAATGAGLMWFYGDAAEPTAQRFYLPAAALLALGVLSLRTWFPGRQPALLLLAAALAIGAVRLAAVRAGDACPLPKTARLAANVDAVLPRLAPHRESAVVVSTLAQFLIVRGFAALSPNGLERHAQRLSTAQRRGVVRDVFVLVTPMDPGEAGRLGSIERVVRAAPATEFAFVDGDLPIVLFRRR